MDLALQYQDLNVFAFPRDMILKRVERREDVGSIDLESDFCVAVNGSK